MRSVSSLRGTTGGKGKAYEEFLEFRGKVMGAIWDVEVSENENEDHGC